MTSGEHMSQTSTLHHFCIKLSYINFLPKKTSWNAVFWLFVQIILWKIWVLRTWFWECASFSFPVATCFFYTIIKACNLWENKWLSRIFPGKSYWGIVLSTMFSGWYSKISKITFEWQHLWLGSTVSSANFNRRCLLQVDFLPLPLTCLKHSACYSCGNQIFL